MGPASPFRRTRFAPAPTGLLHLGHVVNAIHVWGLARATGAQVLLRVEDHDRERSRPAFESALLDDLDWLGFIPDVFPTSSFRAGRCDSRQSDRGAIYAAAADGLIARGLVYACRCSRLDIAAPDPAHATAADIERRSPGTCRARAEPPVPGLPWRLCLEPATVAFDDLLAGPQVQAPAAQCGDVVIRDRRGNWTYQFAVTVDDLRQDVDLVVRGRDLLSSTGRQIQMATMIGRARAATFAHHGLVMKSPTQKLSKADGDSGVRDLRAAGWSAARVVGLAACRSGLVANADELPAEDAITLASKVAPSVAGGATL